VRRRSTAANASSGDPVLHRIPLLHGLGFVL
jgi:hypothetical protein